MNNYRHGDVTFHETQDAIALGHDQKKLKRNLTSYVVALGEATGHKHLMTMDEPGTLEVLEEDGEGNAVFHLKSRGVMTHEEHAPITLEPGIYIRKIEQEYDPFRDEARLALD